MAKQGLKNVSTAVMICLFLYEPFLRECMKDTDWASIIIVLGVT